MLLPETISGRLWFYCCNYVKWFNAFILFHRANVIVTMVLEQQLYQIKHHQFHHQIIQQQALDGWVFFW